MPNEKDKNDAIEFKIIDKRFSSKISEESRERKESISEKDRVAEYEQAEGKKKSLKERLFGKRKVDSHNHEGLKLDNQEPTRTPDFSSFILSLSTQAMIHLGEIPNPITQKKEKNLDLAKQTIDLIGILKEKTKGNLTAAEEQLIENLLYELRMRYVKEIK